MDQFTESTPQDVQIRFRSGRKPKRFRQRAESPDVDSVTSPQPRPEPSLHDAARREDDDDDGAAAAAKGAADDPSKEEDSENAVAAALRARNARRARHRGLGVGFASAAGRAEDVASTTEQSLVLRGDQDGALDRPPPPVGISDRFMHQTGLLADLDDRHMTEYIESRLHKRAAPSGASSSSPTAPSQQNPNATLANPARHESARPPDQAATHGKLMEVDLDALQQQKQQSQERGAKRQRLGKDGKPWRSRNRRGSDDVKRDQLVEAFLHENRLDVYDVPQPSSSTTAPTNNNNTATTSSDYAAPGDADERLAEQFKQQYMDDLAARRRQKKPPAASRASSSRQQQGGAQKQSSEDVLKGPKLGGSRNARAAVRNALLAKEKEEREKRR